MIELNANESPLPPPPAVRAAMAGALGRLNRYPDRGDERLTAALAAHHGRGLTPAHFMGALSGSDALELVARAHLAPGTEAIISTPAFPVYRRVIALQGAGIVDAPLDPATFAPDIGRILTAVTPRTRLLFLCNPGNPSGVTLGAGDLSRLLDALPPHVLAVLDEVYWHFVTRRDFPDSIGLVLAGRPVVIVHSFSKAYGLAGLRLGYALGTPERLAPLVRHRRDYHLSELHLAAGLAALEARAYVEELVALVAGGRRFLAAELDRLRLAHWPSETNFVMLRAPGDAGRLQAALERRGVLVRTTDGNGLPGHLPVTVGLPDENRAFIAALEAELGAP